MCPLGWKLRRRPPIWAGIGRGCRFAGRSGRAVWTVLVLSEQPHALAWRETCKQPMQTRIIFPWYGREDYDVIRDYCRDHQRLPATFDTWIKMAIAVLDTFRGTDCPVVRVRLRAEEFRTWCEEHAVEPDYAARQRFAAEQRQEAL
jgi:hypothetical protein